MRETKTFAVLMEFQNDLLRRMTFAVDKHILRTDQELENKSVLL